MRGILVKQQNKIIVPFETIEGHFGHLTARAWGYGIPLKLYTRDTETQLKERGVGGVGGSPGRGWCLGIV